MEKRITAVISLVSVFLMCTCIGVLAAVPGIHTAALTMREETEISTRSMLSMLRDNSQLVTSGNEYDRLSEHKLRLEIPTSVKRKDIEIKNDYMNKAISISIPGIGNTYFYDYPMIGVSDGIVDLRYGVDDHRGVIEIQLDTVYECVTTDEEKYLYLDFKKPKEVYDKVVVIDAGHGGYDPGAEQGDLYEKDINLEIVKEIKELFDKGSKNVGVYYTRLSDEFVELDDRVGFANEIEADAFVSVHVNSTDSGRLSGINGTSVMYLVSDKTGKSKELAEGCLNGMLMNMGSGSKGLVPGDEILIIRKSENPVALCEVGFLTNPKEQELLSTQSYRKKAAKGIYKGITQFIEAK